MLPQQWKIQMDSEQDNSQHGLEADSGSTHSLGSSFHTFRSWKPSPGDLEDEETLQETCSSFAEFGSDEEEEADTSTRPKHRPTIESGGGLLEKRLHQLNRQPSFRAEFRDNGSSHSVGSGLCLNKFESDPPLLSAGSIKQEYTLADTNKAAKVIQGFFQCACAVLRSHRQDLKYYKDELKDVERRRLEELDRVQTFLKLEKHKVALQMEQELLEKEQDGDLLLNHKKQVDQYTKDIETEKILHEELKEQVRQLQQDLTSKGTNLTDAQTIAQGLTEQEEELQDRIAHYQLECAQTIVQVLTEQEKELQDRVANYQLQCKETEAKIRLYRITKEDRRDQRKRCERYIDGIIHMVQLKHGHDHPILLKQINQLKQRNEEEQVGKRSNGQSIEREEEGQSHNQAELQSVQSPNVESSPAPAGNQTSPKRHTGTPHVDKHSTHRNPKRQFLPDEVEQTLHDTDATNSSSRETAKRGRSGKKKLQRHRSKSLSHAKPPLSTGNKLRRSDAGTEQERGSSTRCSRTSTAADRKNTGKKQTSVRNLKADTPMDWEAKRADMDWEARASGHSTRESKQRSIKDPTKKERKRRSARGVTKRDMMERSQSVPGLLMLM